MFKECLENVRKNVPLVHNITNYVTVNDVANVLLACGGSPIMSDDIDDVVDITSICGGLNINIGTLNKNTIPSMFAAGKKANELGHVVLLDPVGAGASALRTNTANELMEKVKFDVVRGNISEVKTLMLGTGSTKGVDADINDIVSDDNLMQTISFAKELSQKTEAIIVITGPIDIITDSKNTYIIKNGCPEMSQITGTGCMLSAILGAYIAVNQDNLLDAVSCAVAIMGYSGELAKQKIVKENSGTGSLRVYLIDALSMMNSQLLNGGIQIEKR